MGSTDGPWGCPAQAAPLSADCSLRWDQKITLGASALLLKGQEAEVQSEKDTVAG